MTDENIGPKYKEELDDAIIKISYLFDKVLGVSLAINQKYIICPADFCHIIINVVQILVCETVIEDNDFSIGIREAFVKELTQIFEKKLEVVRACSHPGDGIIEAIKKLGEKTNG